MKKKLVFFIGGLNFGGMERVVFIAKELLEKEYDVKIVTLYQDNADYKTNEEYYNLDVKPSKKRIYTFFKRLIRTIKMKKKLKPDIVFSFGMYLNYLNVLSNYMVKNKPVTIAGIRSYDWLTDPFVTLKIDRWIMQHMNKINSVSKLIAEDAEKVWKIPIKNNPVIYNPYDLDIIEKRSLENIEDFEFEENCYYIITMGRLADQKGYNHLIRAFSKVNAKYKNIKLIIMGNGDKKQDLEKMITEYKLEDYAKLLGGKSNPYKYVKRANLYVLSSLSEGFPNALCETMCIGTPVISVNCKSGPSEILLEQEKCNYNEKGFFIGKYGILTKQLEPDRLYIKKELSPEENSLAEAICFAYENPQIMKEKAIEAKEHMKEFNYYNFQNKLKDILEK